MIRSSKKQPLRGDDIVARFPNGLDVPSFWHSEAQQYVVNIREPIRLYRDPSNRFDAWWVDISSLYEEGEEPRLIKPQYAKYPLRGSANQFVIHG
ncbi:MAG: hypothetical protein JWN89_278 [Parcubacteria group bacterium]|nr:hypothetical protein [Parcubacteria group bacterium]